MTNFHITWLAATGVWHADVVSGAVTSGGPHTGETVVHGADGETIASFTGVRMVTTSPDEAEYFRAPWDEDIQAAVAAYQSQGLFATYRCPAPHSPQQLLVVTDSGFKCSACSFSQDWVQGYPVHIGQTIVALGEEAQEHLAPFPE